MASHLRTKCFDFNPVTRDKNKDNSMKYLIIIMAIMFPIVSPAQSSIAENLMNAERSPLFQQKFSSDQISAKGLDRIELHNGVELQFKKYIILTRLDQNEKFKPLMDTAIVNQYLRSKPSYTENVLQLQDRLIIERSMKVSMKKGICQQKNLPASVNELCFVKSTGPIPTETKKYLSDLRAKLNQARPNTQVKDGMTAKQLSNMSDEELLEALLNSDDREIRLVSVLATEVYRSPTRVNLWNTSKRLKESDFNNGQTTSTVATSQFSNMPIISKQNKDRNQVFPTKYFLTGFTLGREMTDTFEIQLAAATLFTDLYFVRFEYDFSAGMGLRFPFSVSVESRASNGFGRVPLTQGQVLENAPPTTTQTRRPARTKLTAMAQAARPTTATNSTTRDHRSTTSNPDSVAAGTRKSGRITDHRTPAANPAQEMAGEHSSSTEANPVTHADMTISVAPVNVQSNGSPAYPAVNLPQSKYFDGKEFVLEFKAGCKFTASIPGDDINLTCPTDIAFNKSRDIDPVIGAERAELATLWLNGTITGLSVQAWAGKASLDFGIASNLTNGRIHLNSNGFNNTLIENKSRHGFLFQDKNAQSFKVANEHNNSAAFSLDQPSYGFDFELRPVARARFKLDLGIKTLDRTLGPYSLDALSLTVGGFTMGHHDGTVGSHNYGL